jgi:hypothetical protein
MGVIMRNFYSLATVLVGFILCSCVGLLHDAKTGNIERMEKSLEYGTSIETKNEAGSTALIVAAYSRQVEAVEYLCKKGADVNAQNNSGVTALIHAAYYNIYDVAEILVKYGADKTIKDRYGNTALDYAKQHEYTQMISLLEHVDPKYTSISPKQYHKPVTEEPWTGKWSVEGTRNIGGTWAMKQSGRIVKSTGDSHWEIEGKVVGNQLKAKVVGDYNITNKVVLNISSDGQSFKGTMTSGFNNITVRIKGTRK